MIASFKANLSRSVVSLLRLSSGAKHDSFFQHFTGNIEIIISIPHGGSLAPKSLPNRKCNCANKNHEKCPVVWVSDDLTIDLGLEIAKSIRQHCGGDPHVVINHLWRSCHNSQFLIQFYSNFQSLEFSITTFPKNLELPIN